MGEKEFVKIYRTESGNSLSSSASFCFTEYVSLCIPSVFPQEWETFHGVQQKAVCHYIPMSCRLKWKGSNYNANWTQPSTFECSTENWSLHKNSKLWKTGHLRRPHVPVSVQTITAVLCQYTCRINIPSPSSSILKGNGTH